MMTILKTALLILHQILFQVDPLVENRKYEALKIGHVSII